MSGYLRCGGVVVKVRSGVPARIAESAEAAQECDVFWAELPRDSAGDKDICEDVCNGSIAVAGENEAIGENLKLATADAVLAGAGLAGDVRQIYDFAEYQRWIVTWLHFITS